MEMLECIATARAVRFYRAQDVARDTVHSILLAGRASGSGKNTQLWQFVLVSDRDLLVQLAQCGGYSAHLAHAAFAVVILTADNPYVMQTAYFDAGRAAQNMMLAAWAHGLGTCPAGLRGDADRARSLLAVPAEQQIVLAIAFGYPDPDRNGDEIAFRRRVLDQQGRKPLAEIVSENAYGRPMGGAD